MESGRPSVQTIKTPGRFAASKAKAGEKKIKGGIAQLARALAWHARGRRFDSDYLHHEKQSNRVAFFLSRTFCSLRSAPFTIQLRTLGSPIPRNMKYYVYILFSSKLNRYYVGSTSDPEKRLQQHNWGRTKSTKYGVPWVRVHLEEYDSKLESYQREMYIKSQKSRIYIESLLNG